MAQYTKGCSKLEGSSEFQMVSHTLILLSRWLSGKESTCQCRRCKRLGPSLEWEDPLEEEMEIHSSIVAGEIPWTEEPGGLQSMGSQGVGHIETEHVNTQHPSR